MFSSPVRVATLAISGQPVSPYTAHIYIHIFKQLCICMCGHILMLQQPDIGELWSRLRNAPSHSHTLTLIGTVRRNAVAISVEKSTWKICQQQQQHLQQQQQQQLYLQQQQWNPHGSDFNHCAPRSLRFDKHFSHNVRRQPPSAPAPSSSLFNGTPAE